MSLFCEVAARTDVGCVRISNEDDFGYDTGCGIFVVCDGVGGQAAGAVASKIAVHTVLKYFKEVPKRERGKSATDASDCISARASALGEAIQLANQAIREAASHAGGEARWGSTIACVLVDDCFFSVGHVGDSCVYLIREGAIGKLTRDHSLVMEQARLGLISSEEAKRSKLRNVILRALGSEEMARPHLDDLMAASGDVLVLASDGLTTMLSEEEVLRTVTAAVNLEQACNDLIQLAKDAGGKDNITCLLIRFVERPWYQDFFRRLRIWEPGNGKALSKI